ncbi:unnamed protein product, partial [Didymodactylos carnosus]
MARQPVSGTLAGQSVCALPLSSQEWHSTGWIEKLQIHRRDCIIYQPRNDHNVDDNLCVCNRWLHEHRWLHVPQKHTDENAMWSIENNTKTQLTNAYANLENTSAQ